MTKTENYQLNQWESSDRVLREDFNADNRKIDAAIAAVAASAGNCRIVTGSYIGTGTYNNNNTNVKLTLGARPILMLINGGDYSAIIVNANDGFAFFSTVDTRSLSVFYNNGTISWLSSGNAAQQMNTANTTYTYFAFFMQ